MARAGLPAPDRGLSARPPFCCFLFLLLSGPGSHGAHWAPHTCAAAARRLRCHLPVSSPSSVQGGWSMLTLPMKTDRGNKYSGMGLPRKDHAVTWGAVGHARSGSRGHLVSLASPSFMTPSSGALQAGHRHCCSHPHP